MEPTLLIGLGNPGKDYAGNRHNVGFMAAGRIADDYGFSRPAKKFGGVISEGVIDKHKVSMFLPLSYMNLSGGPAGEAARFYKIPPEHIIVIHDELDLPLGSIRVKKGGGHGGHNGLKSLDEHLGKDYWRVRIGIGHPGHKDLVSDYVLSDFAKAEKPAIDDIIQKVSKSFPLLLDNQASTFMEHFG